MSIFSKLEYMQEWTQAEKQLVQLILEDPTLVMDLPSRQLAKKANTSLSTIYRVCEKLEIGGYANLRFQIMQELPFKEKKETDFDRPFKADDTDYELIRSIAALEKKAIDETASLIDLNTVRLIVNRMELVQDINLYTTTKYRNLAFDFKMNMARVQKRVHVLTEVYDQELAALQTRKDTMSIVITYAGRVREVRPILDYLKANDHIVVLISSLWDRTYTKLCDYHLVIASNESPSKGVIGNFGSMTSISFIFDLLYGLYFKRNYKDNLEKSQAPFELLKKAKD